MVLVLTIVCCSARTCASHFCPPKDRLLENVAAVSERAYLADHISCAIWQGVCKDCPRTPPNQSSPPMIHTYDANTLHGLAAWTSGT
eukprot:3308769-Amphidinium_carterae.1